MDTQGRQSFNTALCAISAALHQAADIAGRLKELHDSEIHAALTDFQGKLQTAVSQKGSASPVCLPIATTEVMPSSSFQSDYQQTSITREHPVRRDSNGSQDSAFFPTHPDDSALTHPFMAKVHSIGSTTPSSVRQSRAQERMIDGIRGMWSEANVEVESLDTEIFTVQPHGQPCKLFKGQSIGSMYNARSLHELTCGTLDPFGQLRAFWDIASLVFITYDLIVLPLQAFDVGDLAAFQAIEWIVCSWWTCDIWIAFRTGYIKGNNVEMRPRQVALHYARTWLLCDSVIVAIEWFCRFADLAYSVSLLRTSRALRTIRFLKLIRLTKLPSLKRKFQDHVSSNIIQCCVLLAILGSVLMLTIHTTSCLWYTIGEAHDDGWITYDDYDGKKSELFWYMASFRWTVAQLLGRTDLNPRRNMPERFFTCVVGILLGCVGNAILTSVITKTLLDMGAVLSESSRRQRAVHDYLKANPLPTILSRQVKQCVYDYHDFDQDLQKESQVLTILPQHVQRQVLFEVRSPVLIEHPLFNAVSFERPWVMHLICEQELQKLCGAKDEAVFDSGDVCDRMLFTHNLTAIYGKPVFSKSVRFKEDAFQRSVTRHSTHFNADDLQTSKYDTMDIPKGNWVSEPALWIEWTNQGRLVLKQCGIFFGIHASRLASALGKHPDTFALAFIYAKSFVRELSNQHPSDLTDVLSFQVQLHSPMNLRISIVSATRLFNADGPVGESLNLYSFCKVIGLTHKSSEIGFKTDDVAGSTSEPFWNHSATLSLPRYKLLEFSVWEHSDFGDVELGVARLTAEEFFPQGFEGELKLKNQDDFLQALLKVKIKPDDLTVTQRPKYFSLPSNFLESPMAKSSVPSMFQR